MEFVHVHVHLCKMGDLDGITEWGGQPFQFRGVPSPTGNQRRPRSSARPTRAVTDHQNQPAHLSATSLRTEMFSGVEWGSYDFSEVPSVSMPAQDWNDAAR